MQKTTETLPPALPREVPDYHGRQASHCRALALRAPSSALKTRLLQEAEEHEKIASDIGETDIGETGGEIGAKPVR
jgi:hypothetical protein